MLISRLFTIGIMTAAIMACSNESTDANSAVIPEQSSNSVTSNAPVLKSPAGVWLISSIRSLTWCITKTPKAAIAFAMKIAPALSVVPPRKFTA